MNINFTGVAVQGNNGSSSGRKVCDTLNTLRMRYNGLITAGHEGPNDVFVLETKDDTRNTRTEDRRFDKELKDKLTKDGKIVLETGDLGLLIDTYAYCNE